MAKYYAVRLVVCNSGFGEWERSIYGGDYGRTIKGAIAKATAGDHDPERHGKYLLVGNRRGDVDNPTPEGAPPAEDIRGLIHCEPERVYVVETMYGPQYVGVEEVGA